MKRIITVQDISCVGKCSLTVALPIISAMGVEACVLPTAVLSTHTAFKGFTFRDLTSDIEPICRHWKDENIQFDAIYTGYLGSFEQLDLMHKLMADSGSTALKIVDPCMADNGKLYPGLTQEFAFAMAKLCGKADVVVPNLTEASFMLGIPYQAAGYNKDYIISVLKQLAQLGAKQVVLKGIEFEKENRNSILRCQYRRNQLVFPQKNASKFPRYRRYFCQRFNRSFNARIDLGTVLRFGRRLCSRIH